MMIQSVEIGFMFFTGMCRISFFTGGLYYWSWWKTGFYS
jgi:hypothetical protein